MIDPPTGDNARHLGWHEQIFPVRDAKNARLCSKNLDEWLRGGIDSTHMGSRNMEVLQIQNQLFRIVSGYGNEQSTGSLGIEQ